MLPIHAFSIENFKSFGPKQRLPLSRVNFLFGPNSHGKSSSLVALGILMNGFLKQDFKIGKIEHLDNSPDINIGANLVNNKSNQTKRCFIIECESIERSIFFPDLKNLDETKELPTLVIKKRFYVSDENKIIRFKAVECHNDEEILIIDIKSDLVLLNTDSTYIRFRLDTMIDEKAPKEWSGLVEIDNINIKISELIMSPVIKKKETLEEILLNQEGKSESKFINDLIDSILSKVSWEPRDPSGEPLDWIGPNRMVSDKSYTINGEKDFIDDAFLNQESVEAMNDWLNQNDILDLGYDFILNESEQGTGNIKSVKIKEFGVRKSGDGEFLKLNEVGSGIGHIFQMILPFFNDVKLLIVQQPEIHLHPSLQVQLARALLQLSKVANVQLIFETHSEHFIKAAQLEIAKGIQKDDPVLRKDDLSVLYISKDEEGFSKVKQIEVDETGAFTEPWPDDFFELSADLSLERLRKSIKLRN